jgi:ABC-type transport system substrate-binding protein
MEGNMSKDTNYWTRWSGRRTSRRGLLAAGAAGTAGLAGLGLVGCGDDDSGGKSGGTAAPTTASGATTAPGSTQAASNIPTDINQLKKLTLDQMRTLFSGSRFKDLPGWKKGPQAGGVGRFASRAPVTFDPTSPSGGLMASYMFAHNQLLQIKVNDKVKNPNFMEYEPGLAEKMPEQPDDLTYIFKIRKGVKFQNVAPVNGRELTADDIIYCTEAYRKAPAQGSTYLEVDKVEKVDDYTVKFTMKSPAAYFTTALAVPFHWIFSREQHQSSEGLAKRPIGTGAFLFDSAEDLGGYKFKKNPNYWKKDPDTGMQLPYLDRLETTFYPNYAQQIAAFRANEFDHTWPQNFDAWGQVMESNPDSVTQVTTPAPSFQPYIAMRMDQAPFNDPRVRQALSLLVDRQAIIKSLAQGMAGQGYGQDWTYFGREWPWESTELGKYNKLDVAEAKKLLDAAGVKNVTWDFLLTQFAGFNFEVWQAVAGMWDQAGIKTVIDAPQDPAKWQGQFYGGTFKALVATGLIGPGMDPDTFAYDAMHSKSPKNYIKLNDPKVDELAAKQRRTFKKEDRLQVLKDLMAYDLEQVSRIWLVTPYKINLRKPNFYSLVDVEAAWNPVGWGSVGLEHAWRSS